MRFVFLYRKCRHRVSLVPLPLQDRIKAWITLSASTSYVCFGKLEESSRDRMGLPVAWA